MNQIIYIDNENDNNFNNVLKLKKFYFLIFIIFLILCIVCFAIYVYNLFSKNDYISDKLVNNYNISQLYSNLPANLINSSSTFSVLGIIEIPKLNITYPILSDCTDENLKIAPCKFAGSELNSVGNFCIAGHNYNNSLFFSKIWELCEDDVILIYDLNGNCFRYSVCSVFEVDSKDLSVLESSYYNVCELTLITCNNMNSNRIIIKAVLGN